ncbi:GAF domain-containing protein [Motilibacter rhizosphaerae]|uniref:GAF domain-containing protein n=1 Tax=Motilibacter rhizosphaerae TaxID=598652 RepID=A0A4Q7NGA0_9ACTN|nr:GAF domain-containing protein [Motilibacter rhizosphaerae]RZS82768.1 GAF domain-containing protein [Motilibacter rhizosphaerae]
MIDHDALTSPERLVALAGYDLDSPELRSDLDALCARVAADLEVPISLVTLVLDSAQMNLGQRGIDGTWVSAVGGTPVEWSFCAHSVGNGRPYVVDDMSADPEQRDNPLVRVDGVAAYAGVPLVTGAGHVLGNACVVDVQPHAFSVAELARLEAAAAEALALLEAHRVA